MRKSILIILLIILVDQITKIIIVNTMDLGQSIVLIDGFLAITYHLNTGAAWSILSGQMVFFYLLTSVTVCGLCYYLYKHPELDKLQKAGMYLYIAGAIGNLIDRVRIKAVIDMIDVEIPVIGYDFPIFNIADSALVIGVVLIAISVFRESKNEKRI